MRPTDSRGDGRQSFAALKELVEDVVIGRMADQRVNGYGFGNGGKVAHDVLSPGRRRESLTRPYPTHSYPDPANYPVRKVTLRVKVSHYGMARLLTPWRKGAE